MRMMITIECEVPKDSTFKEEVINWQIGQRRLNDLFTTEAYAAKGDSESILFSNQYWTVLFEKVNSNTQ